MRQELVREWMTPDVLTVTPDTTLPEAHRLMEDNDIRRLPVMKKDKLVGIVTRSDVRGAGPSEATSLNIWEVHYLVARLKVGEIMTSNPVTVSPDATVGEVASLMLEKDIGSLPVVEGGKLVGIITESDIFRMVVHKWSEA